MGMMTHNRWGAGEWRFPGLAQMFWTPTWKHKFIQMDSFLSHMKIKKSHHHYPRAWIHSPAGNKRPREGLFSHWAWDCLAIHQETLGSKKAKAWAAQSGKSYRHRLPSPTWKHQVPHLRKLCPPSSYQVRASTVASWKLWQLNFHENHDF